MFITDDTIVAISSGQGRAGIGVVRLSGPDAFQICLDITGVKPEHKRVFFSNFVDKDGNPIDSGVVLFFKGPNSFTGEDVLELQAHGNPIILTELISRSVELGARQARPGEFTERAFRNDKLTLDQAEAVADLIACQTRRSTISAIRTLTGAFAAKVEKILISIRKSLYQIEATIDFQEDIDTELFANTLRRAWTEQINELNELIGRTEIGVRLKEGFYIAIMGSPNVGKSTLLNRLAGSDKAITSDVPGTTRDPVVVAIDIKGIPVHVVDTAGIRHTTDNLEALGIARARTEAQKADLILYLTDENTSCVDGYKMSAEALDGKTTGDVILVRNKIDLFDQKPGTSTLDQMKIANISAEKGDGIDALLGLIVDLLVPAESVEDEFVARERHLNSLRKAADVLAKVDLNIFESSPELLAEDYRRVCAELDTLTGKYTTEEMLGDIFSRFCIGK